MMLRLIELVTLFRSAPPTTTSSVPPRSTDPMRRLIRDRNRFRPAMRRRMPSRASTSVPSGGGDGTPRQLPGHDLAVGEPHHRVGMAHHFGVVGGEDEGGPVPLVHLLHEIHDPLAGHRVEVRGGLVGEDDLWTPDQGPGHGHALTL